MDNLVAALRAAGHRVELVRLPTAWDRTRIFDAALAWRLVPLDAHLVIATNFPSYFVRHPNKVVWLFHQHRPFYDAAGAPWSDIGDDDESREAQRLLATWDARALGEAVRLFATSGVVAARLARFCGLVAEPLPHPPPLHDALHPGPFGDEVFCATRLEANKRPELMIDAFAHVRAPVRLGIAGHGSLAERLRARVAEAGLEDRVELAGYVDDAELVDRFARALAVLYVPHDEDYGYVTLQAFRAGKPVITTEDAGGVLEWVEDGVTGLVTDGTPAGIAEAVERLAADRDLARKLGDAGAERVAGLSWAPVVERLLGT